MIINLRDIYNYNLTYIEFGALLHLYCIAFDIEDDFQYQVYDDIIYDLLQNKKLVKVTTEKIVLREKGIILMETIVDFSKSAKTASKKPILTDFDEFWDVYPSTDKHSIYFKTRNLKSNKMGCRKKYKELLKEGVLHRDILRALKHEIIERKKSNSEDNKLTFMKNSFTWLNQREFDIILETINDETKENDWTSKSI